MRILYFFLVNKHAELIEKTIELLRRGRGEKDIFLFHIDKNSNEQFDDLKKFPNVIFTEKRFETKWGSPELAFAIVSGLEEIIDTLEFDYVVLLSESDYPVKTADYIHNYLDTSKRDHILITPLPSDNPLATPNCHWAEGGRRRIECYALRLSSKQIATIEPRKIDINNLKQFIKVIRFNSSKFIEAVKIFIKAPKRSHPTDLIPCGGHQWFMLRKKSIMQILQYIQHNKTYVTYSKDTQILDEIFFATLAYNLIDSQDIDSNILRFINWDGGNSPKSIHVNNLSLLKNLVKQENILFARKIESIETAELINTLIATT